ncbi:sensor histidine kinase [Psychromicrobium sp. YIM B11713]|uniref:sensor histidine kinase n=1 Tax=Psychromicrobium sp. YIM B11713 TaxID=3145233 RepID=UPI00374E3FDE
MATLALLTAICFIVGLVCYASMSFVLNNRLNSDLVDSSYRTSTTFSVQTNLNGQSYATVRGIAIGTLIATVPQNAEATGGFVSDSRTGQPDGLQPFSAKDKKTITSIPSDGRFYDAHFDEGDYRLVSIPLSNGTSLITGLPLNDLNDTLATLISTIILVSASGLIAMGMVGTVIIRRAMTPLNQLSAVATKVSQLPLDEGEVNLAERVPTSAANPNTEVGAVGLALNRMLDNVSQALQARQRSETKVRQFVADASHELRTPLTAIRGYTEMLRMTENLSQSGEKSLSRVESQSKRMGAMVEDLLTLARLDEGKPLELADTEMTQLVLETVNDMKVALGDHRWQLDLPSDPFIIKADAGAIRQVLLNLLSNAAKHTDAGTVVTTSLRNVEGGMLRLGVRDNGPGIPKDFQSDIFDRFSRVDVARSGHDGTTGLGLSIVHAIVQAHGGKITLKSEPGDTEFMVDLPRGH